MLKVYRDFLFSYNAARREQVRKRNGDTGLELFDTNRIYYEIKNFVIDPKHPSPLTRINKINKRLAVIEDLEIPLQVVDEISQAESSQTENEANEVPTSLQSEDLPDVLQLDQNKVSPPVD